MSDGGQFQGLKAPDAAMIEALAQACLDAIPVNFQRAFHDIVIQVVDFPDEELAKELELDSPFDLLGLYIGTALTEKSMQDSGATPDVIYLYRRPILDYWATHDESLGRIVAHVLIHEIGHHFGLSDEDMERLENAAAPPEE